LGILVGTGSSTDLIHSFMTLVVPLIYSITVHHILTILILLPIPLYEPFLRLIRFHYSSDSIPLFSHNSIPLFHSPSTLRSIRFVHYLFMISMPTFVTIRFILFIDYFVIPNPPVLVGIRYLVILFGPGEPYRRAFLMAIHGILHVFDEHA